MKVFLITGRGMAGEASACAFVLDFRAAELDFEID